MKNLLCVGGGSSDIHGYGDGISEEDWGDLGIEQDNGTIAEENSW